MKKFLASLAFTALLAGCAGSDEGNNVAEMNRCENVSENIVADIESGLEINGGGSLRRVKAVKSTDFSSLYFISADLEGAGLESTDDIATFATNKLDGTGMIFTVNHTAQTFSVWPFGPNTKAGMSMSDDGAAQSQACAKL